MATERQKAANRRNAASSTGPRTSGGKRRSAQNALSHGLCAKLGTDPEIDQQVEAMAHLLAGENAPAEVLYHARTAATATLQIGRIRRIRTTLFEPSARQQEVFSVSLPPRVRWQLQYKAEKPLGYFHQSKGFYWTSQRFPPPASGYEGELKLLTRLMAQIARLDQYERRALSQRKKALRALDLARTHVSSDQQLDAKPETAP